MKQCSKCKETKDLIEFYELSYYCKYCRKQVSLNNYYKNIEKNKSRVSNYQKLNKDRYNTYQRKIRSTSEYKLIKNIRSRVYKFIKGTYKRSDVGCTIDELKAYLESKFQPGMSWDNYGQWHIDHIIPLSKVDLTDREQFLKVCHYTNLQPLWAADNIRKGNR